VTSASAGSFQAAAAEGLETQQMAQLAQRAISDAEAAVATLHSAAAAAERAAAAAAARATDQGLQLEAFSSTTPSVVVLQALPLGHLTKLDLNFGSTEPLLAAGESHAGKLQQFKLGGHGLGSHVGAEVLLQGVTTLKNLTELQLGPLGTESAGLQPPVSMRRLVVSCVPTYAAPPPLRVAHLTQLTELGFFCGVDVQLAHTVVVDDQLPTSLQMLVVGDINSSASLIRLTNLQSLIVCHCKAPAQLQQLSVLQGNLCEVRLSYYGSVLPVDAAENWDVLRLRSLRLLKAGEDVRGYL
jgi:hypothetical protein